VRSGQLVSFDGNLVIIGDVNPGGEVCGNRTCHCYGSLRGMVHAGANGNREALVVALNLQPTQLRIADVITRPPDEKETVGHFSPNWHMSRMAWYISKDIACKMKQGQFRSMHNILYM